MNDDTEKNVLCCPAGWKVINKDSKDTRASCERCSANTATGVGASCYRKIATTTGNVRQRVSLL